MMQVSGWGGVPGAYKAQVKAGAKRTGGRPKAIPEGMRKVIAQDPRSVRVIAEGYGFSEASVRRCQKELNAPHYRGWVHLRPDVVKDIFRDPRPLRVIAEDYGVTKTTIRNIKARRNHKHVTEHL